MSFYHEKAFLCCHWKRKVEVKYPQSFSLISETFGKIAEFFTYK